MLRTAGVLLGGSALAGVGSAQESGSLELDVLQESINPESPGAIPAVASVDEFPEADETSFPDAVFMGVRDAFGEEGEGFYIEDQEAVASPFQSRAISGDRLVLHFRSGDIDFPDDLFDEDEVTLGLGYFPDDLFTPPENFDTDTVRFAPDGVNGPVG